MFLRNLAVFITAMIQCDSEPAHDMRNDSASVCANGCFQNWKLGFVKV